MNQPNRNKTKKIAVNFGLVPRDIINKEMFRATQIQVGARPVPHIFGNCTWINHPYLSNVTIAQIVFASADEKKLRRIIDKYRGKLVPIDDSMSQWQILETSGSGKEEQVELANERVYI